MKRFRITVYVLPLLVAVLFFSLQSAYGMSLTDGFATLFGEGSSLGAGVAQIQKGGIQGTVEYDVWQTVNSLVFVYQIDVELCTKCTGGLWEFKVRRSNQTPQHPVDWIDKPKQVHEFAPGLGYVKDFTKGVSPEAPYNAYMTKTNGGSLIWEWDDPLANEKSVRLFAMFDASAVTYNPKGDGQLTDISLEIIPVAAPVPVPEPTSLFLVGSGLIGLGLLSRRKSGV